MLFYVTTFVLANKATNIIPTGACSSYRSSLHLVLKCLLGDQIASEQRRRVAVSIRFHQASDFVTTYATFHVVFVWDICSAHV